MVLLFFPAMFGSDPPKWHMSRWGLAKIINHYIIQVPIIIFLVIFSNVSFLSVYFRAVVKRLTDRY